ncbi:hypothetical protein B0H14DRAFT_2797410 [Mycena olivaceomarginata]|nr:hypothetical protein B0H14DRAFT_2797410 [Mycena olivaceomarginata]
MPSLCDSRPRNHTSHSRSNTSSTAFSSCLIQEVHRIPQDSHAPRQFIPYLYLFSPPSLSPGAPPPPGNWTHTIRLLPPSKTRPAGGIDLVSSGVSGSRLDLHLPTAAFKTTRQLHLSPEQLLLARDFLALALPYYASAHPSDIPLHSSTSSSYGGGWSASSPAYTPITHAPLDSFGMTPQVPQLSQADPVRVLVLGPTRLVLAIGLLYLAYASGCRVTQVMRGVLEGDGDAEWCRMIAKDGQMGLSAEDLKSLERVAMNDM